MILLTFMASALLGLVVAWMADLWAQEPEYRALVEFKRRTEGSR